MNRPRAHEPRADAAWLAAALREQADEHEADLARIEAGFHRLTADEPRRTRSRRATGRGRLRLIAVPLGILATAATATVAVAVSLGISDRAGHPSSHAAPPSRPSPTAGDHRPIPQTTPSAVHPAGTASAHSEFSPTPASGPLPLTASGALDSHSNQYWAQEDLSVTTTRAIRALRVTVTVTGGATVQSTGTWSTILSPNLDTAVNRTPSGLTYDIAIKPGQTLQPGTYVFGFQFGHPTTGHNFTLDAYSVTATTTSDAATASADGTFAK